MIKKELKQQNLALFVSLIFLCLVLTGFFWLWRSSQPSSDVSVVLEDKYNIVEIGSIKEQAQELIQSKGNLVEMPIQSPTESVGRGNPFAGI